MALRFKCSACKEDIVVNFYTDTLKIGETVVCKNCSVGNIIPESNMEEEEKPTTKENEKADDQLADAVDWVIESQKEQPEKINTNNAIASDVNDRDYEVLRFIAGIFKVLAGGGCLVMFGFLFGGFQAIYDQNKSFIAVESYVAEFPSFIMAFGALFLIIILMAFQEIIMLFLNIAGDVLSMSKNFSEIRKAIVDKSD